MIRDILRIRSVDRDYTLCTCNCRLPVCVCTGAEPLREIPGPGTKMFTRALKIFSSIYCSRTIASQCSQTCL